MSRPAAFSGQHRTTRCTTWSILPMPPAITTRSGLIWNYPQSSGDVWRGAGDVPNSCEVGDDTMSNPGTSDASKMPERLWNAGGMGRLLRLLVVVACLSWPATLAWNGLRRPAESQLMKEAI